MNPVRAFNIPASDIQKAIDFYETVFDWNIKRIAESGGNYHFAITTPSDETGEPLSKGAINGGFFQRGTHGINETFLELVVESIDDCAEKAISMGGRKISEKRLMAGTSYFAIIQDPEGNYLGLWEEKR